MRAHEWPRRRVGQIIEMPRAPAQIGLDVARLALARIANGDPHAMLLAKLAIADIDEISPLKRTPAGVRS